jgi:AcrR family transcriptional regulator
MRNDKSPPGLSLPDPTLVADGELAKSGTTRRRILDSARDLLATAGFAGFTTAAVAKGAGLTRPAMLYHFGSRQELLNATIHYLVRRRIEIFQEAVADIAPRLGADLVAMRLAIIDITWAQMQSPEQVAITELSAAARTNAELADVVDPALALLDRLRANAAFQALPPDQIVPDDFQLARDVVRFISEGAVRDKALTFASGQRAAALLQFLRVLVTSEVGATFLRTVAEQAGKAGAGEPAAPEPPSA